VLDYDKEADAYDATRGGEPRAAAAAEAVLGFVPQHAQASWTWPAAPASSPAAWPRPAPASG
jgi:hypothetical protein